MGVAELRRRLLQSGPGRSFGSLDRAVGTGRGEKWVGRFHGYLGRNTGRT